MVGVSTRNMYVTMFDESRQSDYTKLSIVWNGEDISISQRYPNLVAVIVDFNVFNLDEAKLALLPEIFHRKTSNTPHYLQLNGCSNTKYLGQCSTLTTLHISNVAFINQSDIDDLSDLQVRSLILDRITFSPDVKIDGIVSTMTNLEQLTLSGISREHILIVLSDVKCLTNLTLLRIECDVNDRELSDQIECLRREMPSLTVRVN
jgi:hypothetical protein